MQSFDAPTTGQQIEQMKSLHGNGVEVLRQLDPDSSEPTWLNSFNAYSVSDTFVTEFDTAEEYQHQQFNATYEAIRSPAFKSVSHDGSSSASFRIEGDSSKPTVNPSQAEDDPENWAFITDPLLCDSWERFLEIGPQRPHLSGRHTQNRAIKNLYGCPICDQRFKRRDNIKPHVRRKHPSHFSSLYAASGHASPRPRTAPNTHQQSLCAEGSSVDDRGCDGNLANHLSPEQELKMPGQVHFEDGYSGASMTRQKQSLSSISLDTTISADSQSPSRPLLRSFDNHSRRTLACPFQKRDPSKHQKCLAMSLQRIKDVKQHIFRCHMSPDYYCASCYEVFDTADDRDSHIRKRLCERLDTPCLPQFDSITERQRNQLKIKSPRHLHVRDQWFQIWDVVFPEFPRPSSAYLGSCLEEMVPLLRTRWERQRSSIAAHVGAVNVGSQRLGCAIDYAMDMFLNSLGSLDAETAGHEMGN